MSKFWELHQYSSKKTSPGCSHDIFSEHEVRKWWSLCQPSCKTLYPSWSDQIVSEVKVFKNLSLHICESWVWWCDTGLSWPWVTSKQSGSFPFPFSGWSLLLILCHCGCRPSPAPVLSWVGSQNYNKEVSGEKIWLYRRNLTHSLFPLLTVCLSLLYQCPDCLSFSVVQQTVCLSLLYQCPSVVDHRVCHEERQDQLDAGDLDVDHRLSVCLWSPPLPQSKTDKKRRVVSLCVWWNTCDSASSVDLSLVSFPLVLSSDILRFLRRNRYTGMGLDESSRIRTCWGTQHLWICQVLVGINSRINVWDTPSTAVQLDTRLFFICIRIKKGERRRVKSVTLKLWSGKKPFDLKEPPRLRVYLEQNKKGWRPRVKKVTVKLWGVRKPDKTLK